MVELGQVRAEAGVAGGRGVLLLGDSVGRKTSWRGLGGSCRG